MAFDLSNPDHAAAVESFLDGRWHEACVILQKLRDDHPDDHVILLLLGKTKYSLGLLEEAIALFNEAVGLKPDFGNAYYELGVCYYRCGRLQKSLDAFNKVLSQGGQGHAMASYFVGLINHLLGNDEAALQGFAGLRRVSRESLIANFYLAQIKMKERKYDEALGLLRELVAETPTLAEVHYLIGTAQFHLHNNSEAIKSYRTTLELNPDDTRARAVLEMLIDV